jgi:hypothetical protein
MKSGFRWFVAVGSVLAGSALAFLELRDPANSAIDRWFWGIVATLVVLFGLVESVLLALGRGGEDTLRR